MSVSAEDMNKLASSLSWEEQWDFLNEHQLSIRMTPSKKRRIWSVDVHRNNDNSLIAGTSSGRRDDAVTTAIAMAKALIS